MKIQISVPTFKKAGNVDTIKILPSAVFYVHKFEVKEYQERHPGMKIREVPDELRGNVAKVRNFILDDTKEFDVSVQIDDDFKSIGYWEENKAVIMKEDQVYRMIEKYSVVCREWGFVLWGIQVNCDKQCYREYSPFSTLSYVSASFSCFLKENVLRYDERFSLKEDYDLTLQMASKYRGLLRLNKFFYEKKGAEQVGGCSVYRNRPVETAQMNMLIKKWGPDLVKRDSLDNSRSHKSEKVRRFDINPIVKVPIKGI
jgi:hypothetical protein